MSSGVILAGIVSNLSIYLGLFLLFVVAPAVLIGSIVATVRTRSRVVPVCALVGGIVGLVYAYPDGFAIFYGDYFYYVLDVLFCGDLIFLASSFPGAMFGLLVLLGIQM